MTEAAKSKKQLAIEVFLGMKDKKRKDIVAEMVRVAGLTTAGAGTYYANLKAGVWDEHGNVHKVYAHQHKTASDKREERVVDTEPVGEMWLYDFDTMLKPELITCFNKYALDPITDYTESREDFITRLKQEIRDCRAELNAK